MGIIASLALGLAFALSVNFFFQLLQMEPESRRIEQYVFTWLKAGNFELPFALLMDPLSGVMMLVVTGISFLIHIYSIGYMAGDKSIHRYFAYLNLFVFFMLLLVMGNNYLILFIGWEGVGLCSYLLIGFWFEDKAKAIAGKKAFIVNRIGDFGFLIGMFLIYTVYGSLVFSDVFKSAAAMGAAPVVTAITLLLFVGATGKSAQIPLYIWLPDAMAGPTPVSALIHAATMVTAGVYMVARSNILYALAPTSLAVVAIVGGATALVAATIGIAQNDIKKVLAYSTVSQLGYMFMALGAGAFAAGIFHLMTHAFFKALLFLGSGSVIHAMHHHYHHLHDHHSDPQDMRNMGGLRKRMPLTFISFFAATLAIAGIPGLSGFFSKDEILWKTFLSGRMGLYVIAVATAGITAFYMFRLVFMTFFGKFRGGKDDHTVHESPLVMTVPLMLLAILSVIGGYVGIPAVLGGGNNFEHFLEPVFAEGEHILHHAAHPAASVEMGLMILSVVVALTGIGISYLFYMKKTDIPKNFVKKFAGLHKVVYNKYYVDEFYRDFVIRPFMKLNEFLSSFFDAKVVDGSVNGIAAAVKWTSGKIKYLQTGLVQFYLLLMTIGIVVILGIIVI